MTPIANAGELGLNVFGLSAHTNRGEGYNEINPGLGIHYVFSHPAPRWELFGDAGTYYDSLRNWAKYAGVGAHYRFAESWKTGVVVAYAKSRSYNSGDPFFALIPSLAFEHHRVVFNAVLLPSENYGSKIAGLAFFVTIPFARGD